MRGLSNAAIFMAVVFLMTAPASDSPWIGYLFGGVFIILAINYRALHNEERKRGR